jgi:hypothetical protein
MKYLYITYKNNRRNTTLSNGTTIVHKVDKVEPIAPTATLHIATPTQDLDIMCADKIHANYRLAHATYMKGIK